MNNTIPSTTAPQGEYRVKLDAYNGPLDLLLYLVRKHEVDLHDIPIAQITDQYFQHLELIQKIDVELAAEFLVMAATLLEIKSALLVPSSPDRERAANGDVDPDADLSDPRYELVQQLLAYKRYKDAATALDERRQQWETRVPLNPSKPPNTAGREDAEPMEIDLDEAGILDLCKTFARLMQSVGHGPGDHEVIDDDIPIALHAEDILDRLQNDGPQTLQNLFVGRRSRSEMVGLFLATLELVRERRIRVIQLRALDDIRLELTDERPPADGTADLAITTTLDPVSATEPH